MAKPESVSADVLDATRLEVDNPVGSRVHPARFLARLAGLATTVLMLLGGVDLMGEHVEEFLQWEVLLIAIAPVPGGLLVCHGPHMLVRLVQVMLGAAAREGVESDELRRMCRRGRRLCYAGGVLALLVCLRAVLCRADHPEVLLVGVAWSLVGPVWAILVAEVGFGSAEHWASCPSIRS